MGTLITRAQHLYRSVSRVGHLWLTLTDTHFTCMQSEFRRSIAVCQVAMPACTDRFPGRMGTLITRTQHLYRSVSRAGHLWLTHH